MKEITIKDDALRLAAEQGMDEFVQVFVDAIRDAIGGELTEQNMGELNSDQITLLGYIILRDELMDGGFVQLIHNGYGPFFFQNPFPRAMKSWGLRKLGKLMYDALALYREHGHEIEKECSEDEFMALFERFPQFDELDDEFVENEEEWTGDIAHYIDEHIERFAIIV